MYSMSTNNTREYKNISMCNPCPCHIDKPHVWFWTRTLVSQSASRDICVSRVSTLTHTSFYHLPCHFFHYLFHISVSTGCTLLSSHTFMVYVTGNDGIVRKYACKTCIKVSQSHGKARSFSLNGCCSSF